MGFVCLGLHSHAVASFSKPRRRRQGPGTLKRSESRGESGPACADMRSVHVEDDG